LYWCNPRVLLWWTGKDLPIDNLHLLRKSIHKFILEGELILPGLLQYDLYIFVYVYIDLLLLSFCPSCMVSMRKDLYSHCLLSNPLVYYLKNKNILNWKKTRATASPCTSLNENDYFPAKYSSLGRICLKIAGRNFIRNVEKKLIKIRLGNYLVVNCKS
jgi:hypothetical protein